MTRCVFFFQAEDGIRDKLVTGVQTCALPISTKHATTKKTPFFMTYGREAILPIDEMDIPGNTAEEESILKRTYDLINLTEERENVRRNIGESQEKQKERYDRKIGYKTKLKIGDKVLLKDVAKE